MSELVGSVQFIPVSQLRERPDLQMRVGGLDAKHVRKLVRSMGAGKPVPPIEVVHVGRAYLVVDGYHRLEAARQLGLKSIEANVTKGTLAEAQLLAFRANNAHGKDYTRKDQQRAWAMFVDQGRHISPHGGVKSSRDISDELGGMYSHETVRKKLKELGYDLQDSAAEYPTGYKAYGDGDSGPSIDERMDEARHHLMAFEELYVGFEPYERHALMVVASNLVSILDNDEDAKAVVPLDL